MTFFIPARDIAMLIRSLEFTLKNATLTEAERFDIQSMLRTLRE